MNKSTKIMISIIAAVLAVCIIITVCVSVSRKNSNKPLEPEQTLSNGQQASDFSDANAQTTAEQNGPIPLQSAILGKWADSANMSGYEFFENGTVKVTYVNLTVPVVNFPINGSADGSYTISDSTLTVKFSIYSKTITKRFTASVEANTLTLKNLEDGDVSTYKKSSDSQTASGESTNAPITESTGITGGWNSSDNKWLYTFNEDSTVRVSLSNVVIPSVSSSPLSGTYNGIYMTDDDEMTVQFMVKDKKVTYEYDYTISGNTLSLKDSTGDVILFVRGTGAISTNSNDLIGKWQDGSGMSGYEFKQGGNVTITYVNFTVPVINMPINGTYNGTYKVKGNNLTVSASIYSKTITDSYTFQVQGNTLTLKESDGNVSVYTRAQ